MSQTKVQLIAPIGVVTASTLETTGVLTATTLVGDIAGTVTGITSTTDNLDVGIVTATAFVGDFTGTASSIVTGSNVTAGIITGTKFVGNATGTVSGLADDTNINVGVLTSTSFVGDLTGNAAGLSTTTANLSLGIVTATSFAGNITGNAAGISVTTTNANLGIITASAFHGSGTNLSGVSAGPVSQQAVTANSGTTTIDLSSGNVIYMTQSANTTVSFANTEGNTDVVYLIRTKDDNTTERTITWPSGMVWDGGTEPTIFTVNATDDYHVIKLTTRDNGATWYGKEVFKNKTGGTMWGWGNNYYGTLGQNNTSAVSSPVQVVGGNGWTSIKTDNGSNSIGGVKNDGTLWSWGYNNFGQLGQNQGSNNVSRSSPTQVPGTTWKHVSIGKPAMGVKTDNTLWAWGYNDEGQLGHNSRTHISSPVQVPGTWATDINSFVSNYLNSMAIKTDGTLWSWGVNFLGTLGLNQAHEARVSSPVQIPGTTWSKVDATGQCTMALKTDGTIWAMGDNQFGSLGQNSLVKYSSPVQIGDQTNWVSISTGNGAQAAVNTSGQLWVWGNNVEGNLGQNNVIKYSSPVQIPGTNWAHCNIGDGEKRFLATKTDGTLWTWGDGMQGQMGNSTAGNNSHYSSPIQIPGTDWNTTRQSITNNAYEQFAIKQ